MHFFPTIDDDDWVKHLRLVAHLPRDATGNADDSNMAGFIAILLELQVRNAEECNDLCKKPVGSIDPLFNLWAMERVGVSQYLLTDRFANQGATGADTEFWQGRIRGIAAKCCTYSIQGSTPDRTLNAFQGHPVVV